MDLDETEKLFPGVRDKISAPKKQSAYAKERQAAEAKKRENEAANAALLKEFESSFDVDDEDDLSRLASRGRPSAPNPRGGAQDRYNARSGPGSLGHAPGFAQPPSLKRKRALEEMREHEAVRREEMLNGRRGSTPQDSRAVEQETEDLLVPKPTMHISSLPPGVTAEQLKAIISPLLNVHSIRIIPNNVRKDSKRSMSAVATLAQDTTVKQIDDAVNQLSDRYVSCGYSMTASRLPINSNLHPSLNGSGGDQPFGAQRMQLKASLRNAPPPDEPGRFAPPDSYERRGPAIREAEVDVDQCLDLPTIRAIHTIADRLLSEENPSRALEIEALLMSLPEVQTDERFSFLFDSKSLAGVYYRYCLWKPEERPPIEIEQLFDDVRTKWRPPTKRMPYSELVHLSSAVDDVDYISSDEESDDERQIPPHEQAQIDAQAKSSITPLQRARLAHLLARLPTANSLLRRGDIARITNFAISHAANGIEELVDILLLNVEMPFSLSEAATYETYDTDQNGASAQDEDEEYDPEAPIMTVEDNEVPAVRADGARDSDPSNAKLVALYVISDILNAIATAEGAKNAWKFRQLFEQGFKSQNTFERLSMLDREYGWGRMKAEQWRRKITGLLDMWEKSSAFGSDVIQALLMSFNQEMQPADEVTVEEQPKIESTNKMPKWMTTIKRDEGNSVSSLSKPALLDPESIAPAAKKEDVTSSTRDSEDDQDVAMPDAPPAAAALDSIPAEQPLSQAMPAESKHEKPPTRESDTKQSVQPTATGPKRRMRAEDMFADSDED